MNTPSTGFHKYGHAKIPLPPFDKGGNLLLPFAKGGREGFDSRFHTLPYLGNGVLSDIQDAIRFASAAVALVVRAAAETDIPAMAAVHAAAFPRQLDSTAWIECNFRAYPRIALFVAERDGAVTGFIEWIQKSGFRKEVVLELEQLAVHPRFQGRGVGTALIKESLAQMNRLLKKRNAGIKNIMVTTRTDNQAQELYRKVLRAKPQAVIKDLYSADEVILLARNVEGYLDRFAQKG